MDSFDTSCNSRFCEKLWTGRVQNLFGDFVLVWLVGDNLRLTPVGVYF